MCERGRVREREEIEREREEIERISSRQAICLVIIINNQSILIKIITPNNDNNINNLLQSQ